MLACALLYWSDMDQSLHQRMSLWTGPQFPTLDKMGGSAGIQAHVVFLDHAKSVVMLKMLVMRSLTGWGSQEPPIPKTQSDSLPPPHPVQWFKGFGDNPVAQQGSRTDFHLLKMTHKLFFRKKKYKAWKQFVFGNKAPCTSPEHLSIETWSSTPTAEVCVISKP